MNSIFGGEISKEALEKIAQKHCDYSKNFTPRASSSGCLHQGDVGMGVVYGTNQGASIAKWQNITVVFNGDIYNKQELPESSQDSLALAIAKLYRQKGNKFTENLNGSFVAAAYDLEKKQIVLARDHQGIGRPLYYTMLAGKLRFGSRIWSLAIDQVPLERNIEDEPFYFIQGFFPGKSTPIKDIFKLRPGEVLTYDLAVKDYRLDKIRENFSWKDFSSREVEKISEKEAVSFFKEIFLKSLKDQVSDIKRPAVLLGGVDSALVAAGLKHIGAEVQTFSFLTPDKRCNQTKVDRVSEFLNTRHNWFEEDARLIAKELPKMPLFIDEPRAELTYMLGTRAISAYVRDNGFDAVFTGDATEDLMLGYPTIHDRVNLVDKISGLPAFIRKLILSSQRFSFFEHAFGHPYRNFIGLARKVQRGSLSKYCFTYRIFDEMSLPRLIKGFEKESLERYYRTIEDLFSEFKDLSPVTIGHEGNLLSASIRYKLNGASDSSDIFVRTPYNHLGFIREYLRMPEKILKPKGEKNSEDAKYLLKKMGGDFGFLPKEAIDQKKLTPGSTPIDFWFQNELKELAISAIDKLPAEFNRSFINSFFKEKPLMEFYRRTFSINRVTSYDIATMVSFSFFWQHIKALQNNETI